MWAVIGAYDGQEHNQFYRDEQDQLIEKGERLPGECVIHAIANPLPTSSSATHVYGGDLMEAQGAACGIRAHKMGKTMPWTICSPTLRT